MTQPRPTADELLDAVRAFLEDDLAPSLEGRLRFHTRVAANVLAALGRELREGPEAEAAERARLVALLTGGGETGAGPDGDGDGAGDGEVGADPEREGSLEDGVDALSRALAARIRAGEIALDDPDLLTHLVETTRADVAIANPRHLGSTSPSGSASGEPPGQ